MKYFHKLLIILPSVFCLSMGSAAEAEAEAWMNAEISIHVWQKAQTDEAELKEHSGFYYQQGNSFKELKLIDGMRTDALNYTGTTQFGLYRKIVIEDKEVYRAVASAKLNASWSQVLIYLFPRDDGQYTMGALDISTLMNQQGKFDVMNFSNYPVRVTSGAKKPFFCQPKGRMQLDIDDIQQYRLPLKMEVMINEEWRQVYSRAVAARPDANYIGVFYQNPGKSDQFRFLIERGLKKPTNELNQN